MNDSTETPSPNQFHYLKVLIVGDGGVGKSSFLTRYMYGNFNPRYIPTLGVEVHVLNFRNVRINCWDYAGQEIFQQDLEGCPHPDAVIVMFDKSRKSTLSGCTRWVKAVLKKFGGNIPIILCGGKSDLDDQHKPITLSHIKAWCNQNFPNPSPDSLNYLPIPYFDVSAKNNSNIETPFLKIIQLLHH